MHLRTLTLRGFKSFATSTTMSFEPGINCVVGPNGSGKSNVVDALSWVMGEQGVKNLRGGNMADVIFAGTAKRPGLGRAEVSLTIDNADGALPIDYSEVTISRTLFRSGGSEYAINGTACRLLDIQELLSDTGMGREMHVIIGQGRLDEVLQATPEDRRGFIEEAAGVLKHRRRKEKALRKLESMKSSFTRIEDLTTELRRQLGPLAKQAEAARRAQVIQATARDARARLLADDLAQQEARVRSHTLDETKIKEQQASLAERVKTARAELGRLEEAALEASPELARLGERWERITSLEERFRSLVELAAERHRSLSSLQKPYHGERPEDIMARAEEARAEEEELAQRVANAQDGLTEAISRREELEAVERTAEREKAELTRALADRREDAARLAGQIVAARGRVDALESEIDRVKQAAQAAQSRAAEASAQCAQLEQDIVASSDGDDTLTRAHEESASALATANENLDTARAVAQSAREAVATWEAKADTLKLSLVPEDATAWAWEQCAGISGLTRDSLTVSGGWESAAEAVLAGAASGVVADSLDAAVDALRASREQAAGRLHVTYPGSPETSGAESLVRAAIEHLEVGPDAAVVALDVVTVTGSIAPAISSLLEGFALAVDLVTARELVAAGAPGAATLAGDVVTQAGAWGGEASQASILARQMAYDDAVAEAERSREDRIVADEAVKQASQEVEDARVEHDRTGADLSARDSHLTSVTAQLGILRQSLASAREEEARNGERLIAIEAELAARREELGALERRQDASDEDPEDLAERLAQISEHHADAHEATRQARQAETDARLRLRTGEERVRATLGRADALVRSAEALAERIDREERQALRRAEAAKLAQRVGGWAQRALTIAQATRSEIAQARQEAEAAREVRDLELQSARRSLDDAMSAARELEDVAHRQELARAEIRMKYEHLAARSLDELGTDAETLIEEFGPHTPVPTEDGEEVPYVRQDQEKRLARAERDMARLGKINPLALEEHAALEERQRYLANQLADLRKSREDLMGIVEDLDQRVEEVMTAALADVAEKFETVFERLFPGGEGHLIATDPENILTTGLEIEARPPGKRVKRLSLLSGGERSLTAIAFLVAIFMARPSPFYVMDEVEAALDDVNLSRLIDIFKDLQVSSQLLIVTHQKRTMEIADTLYGIAMREDGVSTVVSQRMRDLAPGGA